MQGGNDDTGAGVMGAGAGVTIDDKGRWCRTLGVGMDSGASRNDDIREGGMAIYRNNGRRGRPAGGVAALTLGCPAHRLANRQTILPPRPGGAS